MGGGSKAEPGGSKVGVQIGGCGCGGVLGEY